MSNLARVDRAGRLLPSRGGRPSGARHVGSTAVLLLLAGCATQQGARNQIFDYTSPTSALVTPASFTAKGATEQPKSKSAAALLGPFRTGPGYEVRPDVTNDGRYDVFTFATGSGTYTVTSEALARKHIQELIALDQLKKYSGAKEFAQGVGKAAIGPVTGVFQTVAHPVGATKATYSNVQRRLKSVRRGLARAGEVVTTFGKPEKRQPDREKESLVEKIVDRPKARRRLANTLGVDPYTHYVPLAKELKKVASYSAAGSFGIDRASSFIPGGAGIVISSLQRLDSLTETSLDMDPGETAAINRERLKKLGIPDETAKKLLLSDKLTPTERTQAVAYLDSLSATPGAEKLALLVATRDTRHGAYAALQTLGFVSAMPIVGERIANVDAVDGIPVLTAAGGKRIAIVTADDFFWTHGNAADVSSLSGELGRQSQASAKKEIWITGKASGTAKAALRNTGWTVKTDVFKSFPSTTTAAAAARSDRTGWRQASGPQ